MGPTGQMRPMCPISLIGPISGVQMGPTGQMRPMCPISLIGPISGVQMGPIGQMRPMCPISPIGPIYPTTSSTAPANNPKPSPIGDRGFSTSRDAFALAFHPRS
ncbi:hypothetical protein Pla52n_00640 [Stieleria varia]|uniref:Uncharacterized protein n=1 Tax=Stieleria varia TaxID=2528005 RepID=A0A5C6B7U6_9BACT|nr:hypothetical protein Pla52n_00640 [Stieleria varia]